MTNWWPMIRIAWRTARRITGSPTRPTRRLKRVVHVAPGVVGQVDQVAGQHQAPGRGVDEHRIGLAQVLLPVGVAELVADQLVGGVLVGNAQQRLGHAHQQHAFLAAQVVLAHEGFDRALVCARGRARGARGRRRWPGRRRDRRRAGAPASSSSRTACGFVAHPGGGDRAAKCARRRRQLRGEHRVRRRVGRGQRRKGGVWGHRPVSSGCAGSREVGHFSGRAAGSAPCAACRRAGRGLPFQGFRGLQGAVRGVIADQSRCSSNPTDPARVPRRRRGRSTARRLPRLPSHRSGARARVVRAAQFRMTHHEIWGSM